MHDLLGRERFPRKSYGGDLRSCSNRKTEKEIAWAFITPWEYRGSGLRHEKEEGPEIMKEKLAESLEHVEILPPGKDDTCPTRTIISESMGIITRVVASEGNCVYEMKVPLKADSVNKFAINAGPGETIRLTLETSPAL